MVGGGGCGRIPLLPAVRERYQFEYPSTGRPLCHVPGEAEAAVGELQDLFVKVAGSGRLWIGCRRVSGLVHIQLRARNLFAACNSGLVPSPRSPTAASFA